MAELITDEMVEAFKRAWFEHADQLDWVRAALAAVLTEPRVLRMAAGVLDRLATGRPHSADCDAAAQTCSDEARRLEKEQSRE